MNLTQLEKEKRKILSMASKRMLFLVFSAILMAVLFAYSLTVGSADISMAEVFHGVMNRFFPDLFEVARRVCTVVWRLRMPRILIAVLAGATLGMAGCSTQAILKNPLATPYTLGVSAGAGFGASVWFIFGIGLLNGTYGVIGNAFLFSLIPAFLILMASRRMGIAPETVILSGVAMAYIFAASNTILQFFARDDALRASVFWLVGDLTRSAMYQVPYVSSAMVVIFLINMFLARDVNIIGMGDDDARGMGVNVEAVKKAIIISACLATSAVISFTGAIGFVGLLAPHISRLFIGSDHKFLIPASALLGACLMIAADIVARSLFAPVLLPVGAVTALLGGPLLLYLLLFRGRGRYRIRIRSHINS